MDVAAIEPGRDFRKAIDQSVATCSVLLAVIGKEWLDSRDSMGGRRLEDTNDFVRIELASALRRDIPVVPVLVRGATMPRAEQLPDDLKELAYRNAVELTHARWKSDVQVLIRSLGPCLEVPRPDASQRRDGDAEKRTRAPWEDVTAATLVEHRTDAPAVSSAIEAQTIERISRDLAIYIGPIAELVVRRAAKRSSSLEELYETVSGEIEADADRSSFLRLCRR